MTTLGESDEGFGRRRLIGTGLGVVGGAAALASLAQPAQAAASNAEFWSYPPTRVVDSRVGQGTTKGKIKGGQSRTIGLSNFVSGFMLTAIFNVTVTDTEHTGHLILWQSDQSRPSTSNINWWGPGQTYGNLAIVGLRSTPVTFDVYCGGSTSSTHFLVDLLGYYYRGAGANARPAVEKRPEG